jgi:hypothetical protein
MEAKTNSAESAYLSQLQAYLSHEGVRKLQTLIRECYDPLTLKFGITTKRSRTIVDILGEMHIELEILYHRYHVHILQDSPAVIIVIGIVLGLATAFIGWKSTG